MTALEVKLPDGCVATVHPDGEQRQAFDLACGHDDGRWRFEVMRDDAGWRARTSGTQQALAVAPVDDTPPRPRVGEIRTWTDFMSKTRQGRVTSVSERDVTIALGSGSIAVVTHEQLHPLEPEEEQPGVAEAREEQVARARAWLDTTLTTRLTDAVTGAWQALIEIDPDADSDELKLKAAELVTGKANELAADLVRHVAAKAGRIEVKNLEQEPSPYAYACGQCGVVGSACRHRP